ncbi:hypothetical protein BJY00DRAFT_320474 [Aspergillus carlsbadensis]|nr:hypothetical protein BJY00DRAFT_320474 [Aspergillus carlsbadensis]
MIANDPSVRGAQKRLRATHTKSRQGCYTCKSRRVKCDEAKPRCGACALRNEPCGFPTSTSRQPRRERHDQQPPPPMAGDVRQRPPGFSNGGSPRALDFNLPSPPAPTAEANCGPMNMVDLRLLSHFMTQTCKHMSLNPYRLKIWETIIPKLAAEHGFLMHLLLALAGMDHFLVDTSPPTASGPAGSATRSDHPTSMDAAHYMQVVVGHHQSGLQGLRDQLSTLSDANCNEVFAGSLLLVGFAFASLRVRNWSDSRTLIVPPLPKIRLDWIYLIRGLTTVVRQCWPSLRMGPFREILLYPGATEDLKMYPDTMFTAVTAPAGCSPRIARFCHGAYEALERLRALQESTTPSPMATSTATDTAMDEDSPQSRPDPDPDATSAALTDGIDLLESIYMRILYIVQFAREGSDTAISLAIQADMENAAVMGWPQALSGEFLASLGGGGGPEVAPNASLVVLAHFYLTLALFEATWFLNGAFDEDIMKMHALFRDSGHETFIALMEWPVSVLNG